VAVTAIFYAIEMLGARVVSTAAAYRQIRDQLMSNIRLYQHLFPTYRMLESQIKIGDKWIYSGVATDNAATFQGFHDLGFETEHKQPLLIIIDEAAGVKDVIYEQITRCKPDYLLVMGSPLGPEGTFYHIETDANMASLFKHFKITQFDVLKENGYWLERKVIDDTIKERGIDHPLIQSMVFAQFGSNIENGLISLTELDKCYEFPPKEFGSEKHVGIDVATTGDSNVIAFRNGNKVEIIAQWREPEVMRSCDRILRELNELKDKHNISAAQVSLDADGMGIGFISRLKDLGWHVNEYHGGKSPLNPQYASCIAEAWMEAVKKIKSCSIILPKSDELRMQILSRKQLFNDKGKLKLESKQEMRGRGIHSPDLADAVFIAMSNPQAGIITKAVSQYTPRPHEYKMWT
jgi:hypothetical protein